MISWQHISRKKPSKLQKREFLVWLRHQDGSCYPEIVHWDYAYQAWRSSTGDEYCMGDDWEYWSEINPATKRYKIPDKKVP